MIDLELLRKNPEIIEEEIKNRGMKIDVRADIKLDTERRSLIVRIDDIRAKKNEASKLIPKIAGTEKEKMINKMKSLNEDLSSLESQFEELDRRFFKNLAGYPNITHQSVPVGKDESGNISLYFVGNKPEFDFKVKNHVELGVGLDLIDEERASKISGARFVFLKNEVVLLQFALVQYVMNLLIGKGHIPLIPPVLVKERAMYGTGFFPAEATQYYKTELDDLFLIGTAEVPLCAFHSDETIDAARLPLKYAAYSTCFRREAGSYGKDMGGLFRVHQFDKIEMFIFASPEKSWQSYEYLRETLEEIVKGLGLHYRLMNMCTGDLGTPNAKKYDLEVWMPGQNTYREIASCSNDTEFQARRLNIKFKDGDKKGFVHTMNSTACAVGRTIMAIMENYQDQDGNIVIPDKLVHYMGGLKIISRKK
ncbi:MAG: serine--tRNA ligase [Actinobacteria bacterium]|nr:serine--tRNA ligase [Actinomycetota bacterium]